MADISSPLTYNFFSKKTLEVKFSGLDLSSDAGLLLVRQAETLTTDLSGSCKRVWKISEIPLKSNIRLAS